MPSDTKSGPKKFWTDVLPLPWKKADVASTLAKTGYAFLNTDEVLKALTTYWVTHQFRATKMTGAQIRKELHKLQKDAERLSLILSDLSDRTVMAVGHKNTQSFKEALQKFQTQVVHGQEELATYEASGRPTEKHLYDLIFALHRMFQKEKNLSKRKSPPHIHAILDMTFKNILGLTTPTIKAISLILKNKKPSKNTVTYFQKPL